MTKTSFTSPPAHFHPFSSGILMQLLSLVSITYLCVLSAMNCPQTEAHSVFASWLLALKRRTYLARVSPATASFSTGSGWEAANTFRSFQTLFTNLMVTGLRDRGCGLRTNCYMLVFSNHLLWKCCSRQNQSELITETGREILRETSLKLKTLLGLNPDETNQWGMCS